MRGQTSVEFLVLVAGAVLLSTFTGLMMFSIGKISYNHNTRFEPEMNHVPTCSVSTGLASITVYARDDCCLYSADVFVDGNIVGSCPLRGREDNCTMLYNLLPGVREVKARVLDTSGNIGVCSLT